MVSEVYVLCTTLAWAFRDQYTIHATCMWDVHVGRGVNGGGRGVNGGGWGEQ